MNHGYNLSVFHKFIHKQDFLITKCIYYNETQNGKSIVHTSKFQILIIISISTRHLIKFDTTSIYINKFEPWVNLI